MEACSGRSLLIYSPRASQPARAGNAETDREREKEIVGLLMVICNNKWGGTLKRITLSARHNTARVNSYTQCQAHINIIFYGHAEIMIRNSSPPRVLLAVYNAPPRSHISAAHTRLHHRTQITTLFHQRLTHTSYNAITCIMLGAYTQIPPLMCASSRKAPNIHFNAHTCAWFFSFSGIFDTCAARFCLHCKIIRFLDRLWRLYEVKLLKVKT